MRKHITLLTLFVGLFTSTLYADCSFNGVLEVNNSDGAGAINFPDIVNGGAGGTLTASGLPVELVAFDARAVSEGIQLQWQTATEVNNSHFEVLHPFPEKERLQLFPIMLWCTVLPVPETTITNYYKWILMDKPIDLILL